MATAVLHALDAFDLEVPLPGVAESGRELEEEELMLGD